MLTAAALRLPALRLAALRLPALRLSALRVPKLERRHCATFVLVAMLCLNLFAGLSLFGIGSDGHAAAKVTANLPEAAKAAVPGAEPLQFKQVAPTDAVTINAAVPLSTAPNPAATAFALLARTQSDGARALECLTAAVYYEAAIEPLDGQRAVAQVVLNRVRHPAYPTSVCGVVYQGSQRATGCQFTFTCDGSLRRTPSAAGWARAREVAAAALAGYVYAPVGHATHYHTNWVVPYWSSSLEKITMVGTHIFYRWAGGWGKPRAFTQTHSGTEPSPAVLAARQEAATALAEAGTTDALATEAAEAAGTPTSIDSFKRAVSRRYVPADRTGVAAVLAAQTRSGETVAKSHLWALTGDGSAGTQAPLGSKAAAAPKAEAPAAAKPACLDGVKKAGEDSALSC